jgi:hypothetical protein
MKAPTSLLDRPGRAAAVVGTVLAVSAGTTMALVATAAADEPGRCVTNVNVREQPDITSRIVALCEAGTEVQVGETRDGFVQLTNLGGWSAQQYVSVAGRPPAEPAAPATGSGPDDDATSSGSGAANSTGDDTDNSTADQNTDENADDSADDSAGGTAADDAGSASVPGTEDEDAAEEESGPGSGLIG